MKLALVFSALLAAAEVVASAAGPTAPSTTVGQPGSGFELRVPAPGPDATADTILQEAIDSVASTGGCAVLLTGNVVMKKTEAR
jgi:hypothetical protein